MVQARIVPFDIGTDHLTVKGDVSVDELKHLSSWLPTHHHPEKHSRLDSSSRRSHTRVALGDCYSSGIFGLSSSLVVGPVVFSHRAFADVVLMAQGRCWSIFPP